MSDPAKELVLPFEALLAATGASMTIAVFMLVQARLDRARRWLYAFASIAWFARVLVDFSKEGLGLTMPTYEFLRLFTITLYAAAILHLVDVGRRAAWAGTLLVWGVGAYAFATMWQAATSAAFATAFGVAALAHAHQYWRSRGFATCILAVTTAMHAIMCAFFLPVVRRALETGDSSLLQHGYWHFALAMLISIAGWIQLPRELSGKSPVRVDPRAALAFAAAMLLCEAGIQASLLVWKAPTESPVLLGAFSVMQAGIALLLYFFHSHQLVIYTDNVAALLEERTSELRDAQGELQRHNAHQAEQLTAQARELEAQAETLRQRAQVIERQRRLELAAQTAGGAAHDIQNLLAPILFNVDRLSRTADPSASRELAAQMRRQLEQLIDLNGQLLTLSRRGQIAQTPIDLGEMVRELRDQFPGRSIALGGAPGCWVRGSWAQLARAIANLIRNGLDASEEGAGDGVRVRIAREAVPEPRSCHLGFLQPGDYVRVDISDDGPGIPADAIDTIFEPFVSTRCGRGSSGSGLGLAIVTAVVDDHAGVLDLETGPGGTRFTLYLPAAPAPPETRDLSELRGDEVIMLVDDDPGVREHYERQLREAGYDVITAADGTEAIRRLQAEQVDLMVLDLRMPLIGGLETYFAGIHLRPDVRVIIHTSYVDDEEARRLEQLGAEEVLQKPASLRELLEAVRRALDAPSEAASVTA